jgi:hypothetical protein
VTYVAAALLIFSILFVISCRQDQFHEDLAELSQNEDLILHTTGASLNNNFFQDTFVSNLLNITPRTSLWEFPDRDTLKNHLLDIYLADNRLVDLETESLYPAWNLSEPHYFTADFINIYTPFFNITTGTYEGVLVSRYEDGQPRFYYLKRSLVESVDPSPFKDYWTRINDYFQGPLTQENYNSSHAGLASVLPCVRLYAITAGGTEGGDDCGCIGIWPPVDCGIAPCSSPCEIVIGDPPGGGDPDPNDDGTGGDDEIQTFSNENDYNNGYGIRIPGDGSPPSDEYCHELETNELPPYPLNFTYSWSYGDGAAFCSLWDDYIKGFDCNGEVGWEDWPEDDPNDNGGDGGSGGMGKLDIVMTTGYLFKLQLDIIINRHGLDMTAEELRDFLESNCNLSHFNDVENYTKWKLIDEMSPGIHMTDEMRWCLFDNPELIQVVKDAISSGNYSGSNECVNDIICHHAKEEIQIRSGIDIRGDFFSVLQTNMGGCLGMLDFTASIDALYDLILNNPEFPSSIRSLLLQEEPGSNEWVEILDIEYPGEEVIKAWYRLTDEEKELAKTWWVPAALIFLNKSKAEIEASNRFPGSPLHNDKGDAFRHAYFNALNVRSVKTEIVKAFGDAHEIGVPSEFALEVEMDLFNNEIGRIIGNQNWTKSDQELSNTVMNQLNIGDMKYLSPIDYVDPCFYPDVSCPNHPNGTHGILPSTQLIPTNQ